MPPPGSDQRPPTFKNRRLPTRPQQFLDVNAVTFWFYEIRKLDQKSKRKSWFNQQRPMCFMICARPDTCLGRRQIFAVHGEPNNFLWTAEKRVSQYLAEISSIGIVYAAVGDKAVTLSGFSDLDWVGSKFDRKSTTGVVTLVAGGAVS